MDRRHFIQLLACGLTFPALSKAAEKSSAKGKVALALKSSNPAMSTLRIFDWDNLSYQDFPVPLEFPHSVIRDKHEPDIVYVLEVYGSLARINLKTHEAIKVDHRKTGELCGGHGTQSPNGAFLLCTQQDKDRLNSSVVIRDSKTLKQIGVAPPECSHSHQITHLRSSNTAVCGNSVKADGSPGGAITFFDYSKNKILNRISFDNPVMHVLAYSDHEVIGIAQHIAMRQGKSRDFLKETESSSNNIQSYEDNTVQLPSPLYYANVDGEKKILWDEAREDLFRYNFGSALAPKHQAFVTGHIETDTVLLWKDFKVEMVISVKSPGNITVSADESEFMVLSEETVKVFSMLTGKEIRTIRFDKPILLLYPFYA